jgi:hypothetical protein
MDWINLAQNRDQWRALGNKVKYLRVTIKCWGILEKLSDWKLLKEIHIRTKLTFSRKILLWTLS